jgi:uncharacterized damage-inducible protein DinB
MKNNLMEAPEKISHTATVITPQNLVDHWQGHRKVTRRVIEAFPEDKLFTYSVGGMRPFATLVMEMIAMAAPGVRGVATGEWKAYEASSSPATKEELLNLWDAVTEELNTFWSQIPPHRFQEVDVAFGQYEGPNFQTIFYFIDNEIHHRGQGYVYLRSLGIAPPAFWDRN